MCQFGLQHKYARRCVVTVVVLVAGALHAHSEALASCGDYLIHGAAMRHPVGGHAEQRPGAARLDDSAPSALHSSQRNADQRPPRPLSPCASGRCHSLPVWPPLSHPTRMMIPKQAVATADWLSSHCTAVAIPWAFPSDGLLPPVPALGPESPPPRHAFSQA